ncbi:MAG: hypothetical protein CSA45_04015 [Gammaproteobacteria bacterium]|nr:MAG: hypothetical protein CSA45_04015 [Gammaproteobacteria bacterium]
MNVNLNKLQKVTTVALFATALAYVPCASAQELYWRGYIASNGKNVGPIVLQRGATYSIRVSGSFYMGRWYQNGRSILNDACYEFNAHNQPTPITVLQNSLGINYCSQYSSKHNYRSAPFVSDGRPLWFRIVDTDYRDNRGGLNASVFLHQAAGANDNQGSQSLDLLGVPLTN